MVRLVGLKNPSEVDAEFARSMVDVACVVSTTDDSADVDVEVEVDLKNVEDRDWLTEIFQPLLRQCGETNARIEFLADRDS